MARAAKETQAKPDDSEIGGFHPAMRHARQGLEAVNSFEMRSNVHGLLPKDAHPPDLEERAVELMLEQAELIASAERPDL